MSANFRVFIATHPFGKAGTKPLDLLISSGLELIFNPLGRRLKESEVGEYIQDVDATIAGTEPYPVNALKNSRVKVISRVGIGLDNVPLDYCEKKGIVVTYTPDAPSQAVAELTLANIINLNRNILSSDHSVREGAWNRYMGHLLEEITIGIIGVGRIGKRVCRLLEPFHTNIIAHDIKPDVAFGKSINLKWVDKEEILKESDLISLHIPYNTNNHRYIDRKALSIMKTGALIVNTSRGAIVDEKALLDALIQKHIAGAAIDVFEKEPYEGPLTHFDNVILTAHMGASAKGSRYLMELGAAEDCINALEGKPLKNDAIKDWQEALKQESMK
jgi:D-3-phosphoglycerate dehydrogenase